MHVFFITAQILLLRKNFEKRQFLQIAVSFIFGVYTDFTMWLTGFLQIPYTLNPLIGYPLRFLELLAGGAVLAFGIACEVRCDSLMLAGEGFPLAISKFTGKDFSKVKICTDTFLVCTAVVFMFVFFGHWDWKMVGAGTLVSMFYVGFMVRVISPHIGWLDCIFIPASERRAASAKASSDAWGDYLVVTVARMYGSGGNAVGEEVARRLGCPCYSRQIIDSTAEKMGYTPEYVEENEQNISTARLWELIFTDNSIPMSMNPSREDAIYVSESRTIRELAHQGPCVIVGRLGNWVLRDNPHVLRVFIGSDKDLAVKMVSDRLGISEEKASAKIDRVNTGRANHYWEYTGKQWTDAAGYDLVLNTGRLGIEGAADAIISAAKSMRP